MSAGEEIERWQEGKGEVKRGEGYVGGGCLLYRFQCVVESESEEDGKQEKMEI